MKRDVNGRLEPIDADTFHKDVKAARKHKPSMLLAHVGEVITTRQALYDLVTHELVDNSAVFVVLGLVQARLAHDLVAEHAVFIRRTAIASAAAVFVADGAE